MPNALLRSGGVLARLVLLVVIAVAMAVLTATLALPPAVLASDALETVERDVFDVPPLPSAEPLIENSFVYDASGRELAEISKNESRLVVPLESIPVSLQHAVIATEDNAFYEHDGVNAGSIARAFVGNQVAGSIQSGASTITQQYVKNVYIAADRRTEQTYDRKIQEALWAIQLEERLTKSEILEGYLNRIALGQGVYGVSKAAERYFSVDVEDLTLPQAATIAGMVRSPEGNNPITNPQNALQRRNVVLQQMADQEFISQEQAERASGRPLGVDVSEERDFREPFWVDFVTRQLYNQGAADAMGLPQDLLDTLGADQEARIAAVFQGGLRIHTTLRPRLQNEAVASITRALTYEGEPREQVAREPYGGLVSVVPGNGAISTMALGPVAYGVCEDPIGYDDAGRELCDQTKFNPLIPADTGSSRTGRQPGSSFKPLLITAALEAGFPPGWTADVTSGQLIDGPAQCSQAEDWEPSNFGDGGGGTTLDMYSGVKASSNVFHAKLISEVGPQKVVQTAQRMGIGSDILPVCSIALGSGEVFPLEMASAYATLAASGSFCQPYAITRIEDREGNLLYEHTPECSQVVEQSIANRVIDIMQGPVTAGGTAPSISGELFPHPVRGKTGTTQDYRDAWFVGTTPQLATAAWVGYPNGRVTYDCERAPDRCAQTDNQCFDVDAATDTRQCVETRFLENATIGGTYRSRVFGGTIPAPMWSDYMRDAMAPMDTGSFPDPGPVPGTVVPSLTGSTDQMRSIAEAANLQFFVQYVSDYRPSGTVLGQSPSAGTSVPAGSGVFLRISDGTGTRPTVPGVVGQGRDAAISALQGAGLGVAVREVEVGRGRDGQVVGQSPSAGSTYEDAPTVTIDVGVFNGDDDGGGGDGGGEGGGGENGGDGGDDE